MNTQYNFLEDHLNTWVPVFTQEARRFSKTLFYQGVAELTEGFLQTESDLLSHLVGGASGEDNEESPDGE